MMTFTCLNGYDRREVSPGTRLRLTYHSARGEAQTPVTVTATVDRISDHKMHMLLWLDIDYRDPRYTLSLFTDDSNLHYVQAPGDIRTANVLDTEITTEIVDE